MSDLTTRAVIDESHALISSARVEGTPVHDLAGEKLGTIHSVMIHKTSGQVAYALLEFGGLFGIGSQVYPLPWAMLRYDPEQRGYRVDVSRERIEQAPSLELDHADRPAEFEAPMYAYWQYPPYL